MLGIWYIMYFTSLVNLELNIQVGQGLSLGSLGKFYSGRTAELIGTLSLKVLSYSLLAVFIYGGASIIQELFLSHTTRQYPLDAIAACFTGITIILLSLPIKFIDYFNRFLFTGLLAVVGILIVALTLTINWTRLPLVSEHYNEPLVWISIIPVVFTSFGFQVIFHTLTNYCNFDVKMLKRAFFWGSLVPAIVYILWTSSVLSVIHHENQPFYTQMSEGKAKVGELVVVLAGIARWESIQVLIGWISLLAIVTSILGVGLGLCDSFKRMLLNAIPNAVMRSLIASALTVVPAYLVVLFVPN
nr:amino acid permease [Nitrosopumilus sp.]